MFGLKVLMAQRRLELWATVDFFLQLPFKVQLPNGERGREGGREMLLAG